MDLETWACIGFAAVAGFAAGALTLEWVWRDLVDSKAKDGHLFSSRGKLYRIKADQ